MGKKIKARKLNFLFKYIYVLCAVLSFVAACGYKDNSIWISLNLLFNNRLALANKAIGYYGIKLLGAGKDAVRYSSISNITVDNGYINLLVADGVIFAVFVVLIWTRIISIVLKKKNRYLLMAVVLLALENLINTHLCSFKLIPFFCLLVNERDSFLCNSKGYDIGKFNYFTGRHRDGQSVFYCKKGGEVHRLWVSVGG